MAPEHKSGPIIVKVGGSLFDLPDLGPRLTRWLGTRHPVILIPGGGPTTDVVRGLDRCHALGEERSHWLALRALALNAHFLAALLPNAAVVESLEACAALWRVGTVPVLDAHAFARADEARPGCLPHRWDVTSDSVAARVARVAGAERLILLKSVSLPTGIDWKQAAEQGYLDGGFANLVGTDFALEAINLREWKG